MKGFFGWSVSFSLLFLLGGCASPFFYPSSQMGATPEFFELPYEKRIIQTPDDEKLYAWVIPSTAKPKATIVFLHGNGGNISAHLPSVFWLPQRGFHVITADYRGFGASSGKPGVEEALTDVESILHYTLNDPVLGRLPVVVFGQSMGGALAITAVDRSGLKDRLAGVAVDGAFSGFGQIAQEVAKRSWITWLLHPFASKLANASLDPVLHIKNLSPLPVLIMHGDRDPIVGYHHAHALYDAALEPKELWVTFGGGHINTLITKTSRDRFTEKIEAMALNKAP